MKKAFTLIELLISMGLMSLFFVVLGNIFVSVLDIKTDSETASIVEIDGRYVLSRLMYDVSRAESIVSPALGVTADTLVLSIDGIEYSYSVDGQVLELTDAVGSFPLISFLTQLSEFEVTRIGNITGKNSLQVSFTLTSQNEVRDYLTTIGLR